MISESVIDIRYPDCDPMGIVHHAVYPVWYEIARMDFFAAAGFPWEQMHRTHIDPAMVNLTVNYKAALHYPGQVTVRVWLLLCEPKKIKLSYECRHNNECVNTAESFHIWVKNADKSVHLCDELPDMYEKLRAALEE